MDLKNLQELDKMFSGSDNPYDESNMSAKQENETNLPMAQNRLLAAVHYAAYGEYGSEKVNCGRYFTTDVLHTDKLDKVTCKWCKRTLHCG